jgi:SulP family sulfate permease
MSKMMQQRGPEYMSAAVVLSGVLECLFGFCKMGKLLDIISESVIAGFLSAVVIFLLKTQVRTSD